MTLMELTDAKDRKFFLNPLEIVGLETRRLSPEDPTIITQIELRGYNAHIYLAVKEDKNVIAAMWAACMKGEQK